MKKLNSVLNIILIIAVAILFYRDFTRDSNESPETQNENIPSASADGFKLAYVNTDSLVENYEYHQELRQQLEAEVKELEADLARRSQTFQENISILEQRAPSMSEEQLQEAQLDLQQTQQRLMMYRDERGQELAQREQELTLLLKEDLDSILAGVKKEYQYDLIFSYDGTSSVLAANPQLEITDIVVKRLNENYQKNKASKTSP